MKAILGLGRRNYTARIGILLVAVALVVSMASCGAEDQFTFYIEPTAGGTTSPTAGQIWVRPAGSIFSLEAFPGGGYQFLYWAGDTDTIRNVYAAKTTIELKGNYTIRAVFAVRGVMVAGGSTHTVGLKEDGTVIAAGSNIFGECEVGSWENIVQVAAGEHHTVGVDTTGAVFAAGMDEGDGRVSGVSSWEGIHQVAAGAEHTVGLNSTYKVLAVGSNSSGQLPGIRWDDLDIIQVAAGMYHTVGLTSTGEVVAVGLNSSGECDVGDWTEIKQVAAGGYHTVGLKQDGTVVAVGRNDKGQCNVGEGKANWYAITQIAAGMHHTVGLKSILGRTTVVAVGSSVYFTRTGGWNDIISIATGLYYTLGVDERYDVFISDREDFRANSGFLDHFPIVRGWNLAST
jgi:hypothetical protein